MVGPIKSTCEQAREKTMSGGKSSAPILPNLEDLEERMRLLNTTSSEVGDTFGQRAEWYYQKRPQLHSLLQDLYNGYITLSNQKHNNFHATYLQSSEDEIVLELVTKNLENEMLSHQIGELERECEDESKMIELLKEILELLEVEREMVATESRRLGVRVAELVEENGELADEAMLMKREAVGLARCVLRMREDYIQKVCILQNRINDLESKSSNKKSKHKSDDAHKNGVHKWFNRLKHINLFSCA